MTKRERIEDLAAEKTNSLQMLEELYSEPAPRDTETAIAIAELHRRVNEIENELYDLVS